MSVVIAKSSVSRMEKPNPFSCSERTRVVLHGQLYTDGSTRRVLPRYVMVGFKKLWTRLSQCTQPLEEYFQRSEGGRDLPRRPLSVAQNA